MSRKMSASEAADQLATLIKSGHYSAAESAAKDHPALEAGVDEYNRRQQAKRPRGSGPALAKSPF